MLIKRHKFSFLLTLLMCLTISTLKIYSQQITSSGMPARLDIREAGTGSIRITLQPVGQVRDFPLNPVLAERKYPDAVISLTELSKPIRKKVGNLFVEVNQDPLSIIVTNEEDEALQELVFRDDGLMTFSLDGQPVLGMGEGGPRPGNDWRNLPIEFDRRGRFHNMQPRWQANAYGSRNPVALMIGTVGLCTLPLHGAR